MKSNKENIRVFEGFAGYGGASYAMKRINMDLHQFRLIYRSKVD